MFTRRPPVTVFDPNSNPLGISYREWCKKWCEWFITIPKGDSPACDNSGVLSSPEQILPGVIFLCQTFEPVKPIPVRNIMTPNGISFFMPIINWISVLGGKERDEIDLINLAKKRMDEVVNIDVWINGKPINVDMNDHRILSPVVRVSLPRDNILDVEHGETSALVDGYWIFFRPLEKILDIETFGACRSGKTEIGVKYHIESEG